MTVYVWLGLIISAGYIGWWVEHRRWCKPGKRHCVYVRDMRLARDKVFLDGLEALIDKAWRKNHNTGSEPSDG